MTKEYDLEIVIPVSGKEKFASRLEDFKQYGLLNIKDESILLTLLTGTEEVTNTDEGWPEGVDIRTVPGDRDHCASKVYEYFSQRSPEDLPARWIAKMDDDSINDVHTLVKRLDEDYDHEGLYYIVTELRHEMHQQENQILKELGFHRWLKGNCTIWHELEASIISRPALYKVLTNPQAMQFMRMRGMIDAGYTDYALAAAARICKIFPADAYFMAHTPLIGHFTLFGGNVAHIHGISKDKNPVAFDTFLKMLKQEMGDQNSKLFGVVCGREFVYGRNPNLGMSLKIIRLNENGRIENASPEEAIWRVANERLDFLKPDGSINVSFSEFDDKEIRGKANLYGQWVDLFLRQLI